MKKLLSLDPDVLKRLKKLEKRDRVECLLALVELADTFGQPHRHGGIGIRKLGDQLFECRGKLAWRSCLKTDPKSSSSSSWATTKKSRRFFAPAAWAQVAHDSGLVLPRLAGSGLSVR